MERLDKGQLRQIIEHIPDGVVVIDKDGYITYANDAVEEAFGQRKDDIIGRTFNDPMLKAFALDKETLPTEEHPFVRVIYTGEAVYGMEHTHKRPDGTSIVVSINAMPLKDASGEVQRVVISFRDITHSKVAQECLESSEQNYRSIFNAANDAIFVHDIENGDILDINERAMELYGYTLVEARRLNVMDLSSGEPPFTQREALAWIRKAAREGPQLFEWMARDSRGRTFWVEVHLKKTSLQGHDRLLAVVRDISRRKRMEEDRMQLMTRMQLLLESTDEGIYGIDLEGHCTLLNRSASNMIGYAPEEVLGKNMHELIHHSRADGSPYPVDECKVFQAFKTGKGTRTDTEVFWRKDGTSFPIEYSSYPIIEEGTVQGAVVTFTDISERKRVEEELRFRALLLDSANDSVYVYRIKEDMSPELIYINEAAYRSGGYTREEMLSIPLERLVAPEYRGGAREWMRRVQEIGSTEVESAHTKKDGTIAPVEVVSHLITYRGEKVVVNIARDITERKRREALNTALDDINAAISSTLDFDEIMKRIVSMSADAIGSETIAIELRENGRWRVRYLYGLPEDLLGESLTGTGAQISTYAALGKKPVIVADAYSDPRVDRALMVKYNIRSFLVIPLMIKGTTIGALMFNYHTEAKAFDELQVDFARKLASSISLALENARLYAIEREIADTLQETLIMMPQSLEGVVFGYSYHSATEAAKVGGDFFDLFELEHGLIGIVIGDISGKGLEASALTAIVKNTVRAYAYHEASPAEVLSKTNEVLLKVARPSTFVTLFFGMFDIATGELIYCSAGHTPALLMTILSGLQALQTNSPAIGIFENLTYIDDKISLAAGDTLVLYTDGIIESRNTTNEFYGEERLHAIIERASAGDVHELTGAIIGDVIEFTGGRLLDDVALLVIRPV